ncbi:42634_t:CDS:2, partial [Gigaspora margarita]
VSSTHLIERSRKQNLEIEKLGIYRNIFASSEAEDVSPKDRNIAKWLGLSNQIFAVCLIRNVMEAYDRIEYKIKEKLKICKKEKVLVNGLDFEQKEKEEIEENKEVLIIMECCVPDYGTKEIKDKIMQTKGMGLAKQDNLTERIIANIKQIEVHSKMKVDINTDNKTEVVDKTSNEIDKVEDISSSIWAQASKSSQSFLNQGIQGAEVYAEASNNKEPKSAEESNFSRKKGKERFIMLNWLQENHMHKFVDQKYEPKKKNNNMRYEGKENQNHNIMCALEEKQTSRLVWNLNMASKENWKEYKSSLWKQLHTQVPKFLCSQDTEEIKKGLSDRDEQIDKIWNIIEKAIIRSEESSLPNKVVKPPKQQLVPNRKKHRSKAYMSLGLLISAIRKADHGVQRKRISEENQKLKEKEIKRYIKRRSEMIIKEQRMMLASLLEKLLNKVRLDRVLVKEDLKYRLAVAPSEVLLDTKDHFKGQFRERYSKIEYMTKDWKTVYSLVNEVQENWYDSTLDLVELE